MSKKIIIYESTTENDDDIASSDACESPPAVAFRRALSLEHRRARYRSAETGGPLSPPPVAVFGGGQLRREDRTDGKASSQSSLPGAYFNRRYSGSSLLLSRSRSRMTVKEPIEDKSEPTSSKNSLAEAPSGIEKNHQPPAMSRSQIFRERLLLARPDPPFLFPTPPQSTDALDKLPGKDGERQKTTARQKLILLMMAFSNFSVTIVFSCIAPFFPAEAAYKGATDTEIGLIFGTFELVILVFSPIFGRFISTIGSKFMFTSGLFVTGCTSLLFGFLNRSPPGVTFVGLCFAVRFFEAVGDAAIMTASFAIIAKEFPGRISMIIGILETFSGLGFSLGPPVGGLLYSLGGFQLPFTVLAAFLLFAAALSFPLLPRYEEEEDPNGSTASDAGVNEGSPFLKLIRLPVILLMLLTVVISAASLSFLDPTLGLHLASFELTPVYVGLMFLLTGGVYTISSPILGWLVDRYDNSWVVVTIGCFLSITAWVLIGRAQLWIVGTGLLILGLGISGQFIPVFKTCLDAALSNGFPDDMTTYGIVSGLFQSSMSLGAFVGPTLGGIAVDQFGFTKSVSAIACINGLLVVFLAAFVFVGRSRGNNKIVDLSRSASRCATTIEESGNVRTSAMITTSQELNDNSARLFVSYNKHSYGSITS